MDRNGQCASSNEALIKGDDRCFYALSLVGAPRAEFVTNRGILDFRSLSSVFSKHRENTLKFLSSLEKGTRVRRCFRPSGVRPSTGF